MASIAEWIRSRRSQKTMNGKAIDEALLKELLELASWAPNHRLNHPWRFRVLTSSGIKTVLSEIQSKLSSEEKESFKGPLERVSKAGAVIYVTSLKDPQPVVDEENFAAVCCAVQNILLESTARGLCSFWSTGKFFKQPLMSQILKVSDSERFVGAIWLGYGDQPEAPARKPASEFTTWI